MRRLGTLFLATLLALALASPVAAQPKVTITGLIDSVSSWQKNMSMTDLDLARSGNSDQEWYARTRARPDIVAEVGTTKFVLGLEIDATWGQTGGTDTNLCLNSGDSTGASSKPGSPAGRSAPVNTSH
jgi:hypothetical protein